MGESRNKSTDSLSAAKKKLLEQRLKGRLGATRKASSGLKKRPSSEPPLASPGQRRIWLLHQVIPDSPIYNISQTLTIPSKAVDIQLVRRSMEEMLRRHPILRTTFKLENDQLLQVVRNGVDEDIPVIKDDDPEKLEKTITRKLLTAFDLENDTLFRIIAGTTDTTTILGFSFHHIIFDEWSTGLFFREFSTIYNALLNDVPHNLPAPQFDYLDFAFSQLQQTDSADLDKQLTYWKKTLANPSGPLSLSTDRPYPAAVTDDGSMEQIRIEGDLADALKQLASSGALSGFPIFLFGFQILLGIYSGKDDILIGTPVANRRYRETAQMIGFFLNTLCLRQDFSNDPTTMEGLEVARKSYLEAMANQDVPFDRVLKDLAYERVEGRHPLVQHMFVFQQEDDVAPAVKLGNTSIIPRWIEDGRSKFDITLFVIEGRESFDLAIEYRTCLFNTTSIRKMLERYLVILRSICLNPEVSVSKIDYKTTEDLNHLETFSRGPVSPIAKGGGIEFDFPEGDSRSAAIIESGKTLTYGEIESRISRLAQAIVQESGESNGPVGVHIPRSAGAIITLLAILKAGRPYLPLDPDYPQERIRFMIKDSGADLVITTDELPDTLSDISTAAVTTESRLISHLNQEVPLPRIEPDTPAYIIYTSGSSGTPKGVRVPYKNLQSSTLARIHYYPRHPGRFLLIPSLSFDSSVAGIFWTLSTGGTLCVPDRFIVQDPELLGKFIAAHQVESLLCVPTYYREILRTNDSSIQSLRMAIVAGENCPQSLLEAHFTKLSHCRLYNEYGPTEATVWSTVHAFEKADNRAGRIPVGKPIPNSFVHVIDGKDRLMAPGLPGEICIGGNGVTPGYLNRPEDTDRSFQELPSIGRVYRSGDQGMWDESGNLYFLGRLDNQVKVRGYRIETGEVEEALLSHPEVMDVGVIVQEKEGAPNRLVAFLETSLKESPSLTGELQSFLAQHLPEYMIPNRIIAIPDIPRLPNGKIDKQELAKSLKHRQQETETSPAQNNLRGDDSHQNKLFKIIESVLEIQGLKPEDNFFNLGGDSILAIQIVSRARESGIRLTVAKLLTSTTVGELGKTESSHPRETLTGDNPVGASPLTPIQSWLLEKDYIRADHWNLSVLLEFDPVVSSEDVHRCILKLIEHHDALRTSVYRRPSGWDTRILPFTEDLFQLKSITCPEGEEDHSSIINTTAEHLQTSIQLDEGKLVKGAYFEARGDGKNQLLLVIHHMAVDWVSWKILIEDLESLLQKSASSQPLDLADKTLSIRSWANALVGYSETGKLKEETQFWKNQAYGKCQPLPLDTGTHSDNLEESEEVLCLDFNENETKRIIEAARELGITVQAILYGGLLRALSTLTSSRTVLVDLEGHGREECICGFDTTRTVGWFTSQFPVVFKIKDGISERAYFRNIQAQLDEVPENGIGFGILKYLGRNNTDLSTVPIPDVTLNYLGKLEATRQDGLLSAVKWSVGPDRDPHSRRTAVLEINAYLSSGRLIANWSFSRNLHGRSTIEGLADEAREFIRGATVSALKSKSGALSYRLTDAQSTLLAHHLQSRSRDMGMIQMQVELSGPVNELPLKKTWDGLVKSFPVLRTTVHHENKSPPAQTIHPHIDWTLSFEDNREKSSEEFSRCLKEYLEVDADKPLHLNKWPSFRLKCFRASDTRATLIWTCHHILLDGWSSAIILERMVHLYNQFLQGDSPELPQAVPFSEYCEWLTSQPETLARTFWKSRFEGLTFSPLLSEALEPPSDDKGSGLAPCKASIRLNMLENGKLESLASECRVSPFAVLLSSWSILLSELLDTDQVVTGLTVSGRYDRIPGESELAGMLANTIPVIVNPDSELSLREWIKQFFKDLQEYRTYDYCSEKQIYEWTGIPRTRALFDCLFVYANQPIKRKTRRDPAKMEIKDLQGDFTSAYPMTVIFRDWDEFYLDVVVDCRVMNPDIASHVTSRFEEVFNSLLSSLDRPVGEVRNTSNPYKRLKPVLHELPGNSKQGGTTPGNPTERTIQEVWESLFQIKPLGLDADFFDLGGNSLMATYLVDELQKALHQPISMETLFECPSVRSMALSIDGQSDERVSDDHQSQLISIQPTGDKIPLVMIHPLDGNIFQYHVLGRYLPDDQPLYAIRSPNKPFKDMDEMAENYLALALEQFPDGRFILGGYCFGAGIAFEMLQKTAGRNLPMYPLVAIDFMYLNLVRYRPSYLLRLLREENLQTFTRRIQGWGLKISKRLGRIIKLKEKGLKKNIEDYFELPELPETTKEQIESNFFLLKNRPPKTFNGDVALILSDTVYSRNDKWVGWDRFTRGQIVREIVDVEHTRLMEETEVGKIATALVKILKRINERS